MLNKKILNTALLSVAILAFPAVANAANTSDVTVKINAGVNPPSGKIQFVDVTKNAKIQFKETELTGSALTVKEQAPGTAKILLEDTRENLGSAKSGYSVSVKDVTPTAETNSFSKHNLVLKLASANISGGGSHTHTPVTVGTASEKTIFTGKNEVGVVNKSVSLNPTLDIPAKMELAGNFKATLQWTLTPEVE